MDNKNEICVLRHFTMHKIIINESDTKIKRNKQRQIKSLFRNKTTVPKFKKSERT